MTSEAAEPSVQDLAERLKTFVGRLSILDVRFTRFSGRLLQDAPKPVISATVNRAAQHTFSDDEFLNRFWFRLEFESKDDGVPLSDAADSSGAPKSAHSPDGIVDQELGDSAGSTGRALAQMDIGILVQFAMQPGAEPEPDVVAAFMEQNTNFMVYPYLREAVQSISNRLGLDKIVLGLWLFNEDEPQGSTAVVSPGGWT